MGVRDLRGNLVHNGAWFMPVIEQYFVKGTERRPSLPGYVRPSGIDECARANLYQILAVNESPPPDSQGVRYMNRGTVDHDTWYHIFKDAGLDVKGGDEDDTRIKGFDPNISGKWDMIARHDNLDWLFEWKSTGSVAKSPVWGHIVQWNIYARLLEIPRGFIVKQHPVSWQLIPIQMEYKKEFNDQIFDWLMMTQQCAIDKKLLPYDDECGPGGKWKKTCGLYEYCHSERGNNPFEEFPYDRKENPFLYDKEGKSIKN